MQAGGSRGKEKKKTKEHGHPEIYGKNHSCWQKTHCPKLLAFSLPHPLHGGVHFFPQKNVMCCNPVLLALIFFFLKKEPFNVLQWILPTLHTGNKLEQLFFKTPASLPARYHLQGGKTAVLPSKPTSYQTRAQKLRVWFYRLHCNMLPLLALLFYFFLKKRNQKISKSC